MQQQIFKLAGHTEHPLTIAIVGVLIAAILLVVLVRAKKPMVGWLAAIGIFGLGILPFATSRLVHSLGTYHVRVIVVRPDQSSVEVAQLNSSNGGNLAMVEGGWELDVPAKARPSDGKIVLSALVKDEFLKGSSTLDLNDDYYPTATIQLAAETSARLRGVVVDESLGAVTGAVVSIEGSDEVAITNDLGNFSLPAHAGRGQIVKVFARKGNLTGHLAAPAGKTIEIILDSHE